MAKIDELREQAEELLWEDDDLLVDTINELDNLNGFADGWRGYNMYLLDELYGDMPLRDFMQKVTKDFDINEEYFIETIYGLVSTNDLAEYYRDMTTADEVLDRILSSPRVYINDVDLQDLIDEIQNYDEDEEDDMEESRKIVRRKVCRKVNESAAEKILSGANVRRVLAGRKRRY